MLQNPYPLKLLLWRLFGQGQRHHHDETDHRRQEAEGFVSALPLLT
jgi:hypothetical protein